MKILLTLSHCFYSLLDRFWPLSRLFLASFKLIAIIRFKNILLFGIEFKALLGCFTLSWMYLKPSFKSRFSDSVERVENFGFHEQSQMPMGTGNVVYQVWTGGGTELVSWLKTSSKFDINRQSYMVLRFHQNMISLEAQLNDVNLYVYTQNTVKYCKIRGGNNWSTKLGESLKEFWPIVLSIDDDGNLMSEPPKPIWLFTFQNIGRGLNESTG